jgi:hypothetical protein
MWLLIELKELCQEAGISIQNATKQEPKTHQKPDQDQTRPKQKTTPKTNTQSLAKLQPFVCNPNPTIPKHHHTSTNIRYAMQTHPSPKI